MLLTAENYASGFLVDAETIAGVTQVGDGGAACFAAYVSHALTGETLQYQEFARLDEALAHLSAIDRPWAYEAVGCTKKAKSCGGGCSCG
jgi:hypothetical protein